MGPFAEALILVPNDIEDQLSIKTDEEEEASDAESVLPKIPPSALKRKVQTNKAGHTKAVSQKRRLVKTRSIFKATDESQT